MEIFGNDIEHVFTTVLGLEYHISKIEAKYPSVSWEKIYHLLPQEKESKILKEIKKA